MRFLIETLLYAFTLALAVFVMTAPHEALRLIRSLM